LIWEFFENQSVDDLGLMARYEKKKKLLRLEADYKRKTRSKAPHANSDFLIYMLKDIPLTQAEVISECLEKEKRDILLSIDAFNLLRPYIK
jgi:hypothetical protein